MNPQPQQQQSQARAPSDTRLGDRPPLGSAAGSGALGVPVASLFGQTAGQQPLPPLSREQIDFLLQTQAQQQPLLQPRLPQPSLPPLPVSQKSPVPSVGIVQLPSVLPNYGSGILLPPLRNDVFEREMQGAANMMCTSTNENNGNGPISHVTPCRARNMPIDHNFKTAFFVIPGDVQHGQHLVCSYPECRDAGVKFRYCASCQLPVAKRNFRNRHDHGQKSNNANSPSKKSKPVAAKKPKFEESKPKSSNTLKSAPKPLLKTARFTSNNAGSSEDNSSNKAVTNPGAQVSGSGSGSGSGTGGSGENKINVASNSERRVAWTTLLAKRPNSDQGDAMSAWLMEVLAVSDTRENTATTTSESTSSSSSGYSSSSSTGDQSMNSSAAFYNEPNYYSSLTDGSNNYSSNESVSDTTGRKRKQKRSASSNHTISPKKYKAAKSNTT